MVSTYEECDMPKGDGQLGRKRGAYKIVPSVDENKERAISLLEMFKNRIENSHTKVEIADWWSEGDISTLRVDIDDLGNS